VGSAEVEAALRSFREAARSPDPLSASLYATEAGWNSRADSARRLARQVSVDQLDLRMTGPSLTTVDPSKAAMRCEVVKNDQVLDVVFVLLVDEQPWKVEGFSQNRTLVGLFLAGKFTPVVEFHDLPDDPKARAWGERYAQWVQAGEADDEAALSAREAGRTEIVIREVRRFEALFRAMVVFEARKPGEDFGSGFATVLADTPDGLVAVSHGQVPGFYALTEGVEIVWDPEMAGADPKTRISNLLSAVFSQLLGMLGLEGTLPEGSGEGVMRFLEREARAGRLILPNNPRITADLAERVQRRAQQAIGAALQERGIDASLDPDSPEGKAALELHSTYIVRALFAGILVGVGGATLEPSGVPRRLTGLGPWIRAALAHVAAQNREAPA
jgi:hypothetical protein